MPHELNMILGILAGCLTTGAFFPQVVHTWRTKDTKGLSPIMLCMSMIGNLLWIIHGIFINSLPLVISNAVTFVFVSSVLALFITYHRHS